MTLNSPARPSPRGEIRALTGLRGIAALWVMAGHYRASQIPTGGLVQRALDHKGLAVDLFLMLSGFVLAMAYTGALKIRVARGLG